MSATRSSRESGYLLALALAAGVIDAASYLGLGHVFTANMTGNTVLLGVALARHTGADAARAGTALGGFCVGVAVAVPLIRAEGRWPRIAAAALLLETIALAALLVVWAIAGARSPRYWLIVVSAIAMGAQSAAVRSSDVRGVNTTYMTSTLLNAIAGLVAGLVDRARGRARKREREQGPTLPGAAWATYAAGALAGALAEKAWQSGAVAISLAIVGAITAIALLDSRKER